MHLANRKPSADPTPERTVGTPPAPPIPANEAQRLRALRSYQILDTLPEEAFDRLTRLASQILQKPIALVSLVDESRQWFKSRVGLEAHETPRDVAFCAHTICQEDIMVVEDVTRDTRFATNPLVTGNPNIRFYAGAPLRTGDGYKLGTLCVIDHMASSFSDEQAKLLQDLAAIVIDELELRRVAAVAKTAETSLQEAIEALPDGFVLYDKDDRLVRHNRRYAEIYAESADLIQPGALFEDLIRASVARGQYSAAIGREEEWIAERMERHNNPSGPVEQKLPNGTWLRIEERRTHDGGLVGFRIDITELKNREAELEVLATTDGLTGAMNRRPFMEQSAAELNRTDRYGGNAALLMLDIDQFKAINDTCGHSAGDDVLKALVAACGQCLRQPDLLCRYGGEEFAILLPHTDLAGATRLAERLRQAVAALRVPYGDTHIELTASIGVAQRYREESLDDLFCRADKALYRAKQTGRNQVVADAAAAHRSAAD